MLEFLSSILIFISAFFAVAWQKLEGVVPPCSKPISYAIGTFDRQFDVSQKDFLAALTEAEEIWERPLRGEGSSPGRDLFVYSPTNGKLDINLIYDYRQQVTEELGEIKGTVKENETTYHSLENQYVVIKSQYAQIKSVYDANTQIFNKHSAEYEQHISEWNSGDRTNKSEFERLNTEKTDLQTELTKLKATEAELNAKVREINSLVTRLNGLAKTLNLSVDQYNTIGASRGDTFAGGIYTKDEAGERIDIFEFENHEKLVRVLAHELGHALGLDHVEDPQAIMYKFNEGEAAKVTDTDLRALNTLCAIE